jgi:apolipoprotein N-acyltransferase
MGMAPMRGDSSARPPFADSLPLLTGGHGIDPVREREFNSAILFDRDGVIGFRYHKMHLVMFGEYVPLGDWFPFVYRLTPIPAGLASGPAPASFEVRGLRFAPSICFESCVGHLIRRHVVELKAAGTEPDVLVNLTNDGWFYGSHCLDLHLACNVFRAVELRKPMLVAANTGFSAHIDGSGRLLEVGPRRQPAILRAEVEADGRFSAYRLIGDWPAVAMAAIAVFGLAWSWRCAMFDK